MVWEGFYGDLINRTWEFRSKTCYFMRLKQQTYGCGDLMGFGNMTIWWELSKKSMVSKQYPSFQRFDFPVTLFNYF